MGKIVSFTQIKNERLYLDEWISNNLSQGIEEIYLMEDMGSESHADIVAKYGDKVHLYRIEDYFTKEYLYQFISQRVSYQWFLDNFWNDETDIDWCLFLDADEFLNVDEGLDLRSFLSDFSEFTCVYLEWVSYNANGRLKREKGTLKELYKSDESRFIYRFANSAFKSFVNFKYPDKSHFVNVHMYPDGVKTNKEPWDPGKYLENRLSQYVRLDHYMTKSWEDWVLRLKRGNPTKSMRKAETFFELNPEMEKYKEECFKSISGMTFATDKITKDLLPELEMTDKPLFDMQLLGTDECFSPDEYDKKSSIPISHKKIDVGTLISGLTSCEHSHRCFICGGLKLVPNFVEEMNRLISIYPDSIIFLRNNLFYRNNISADDGGIVYHAVTGIDSNFYFGYIVPKKMKDKFEEFDRHYLTQDVSKLYYNLTIPPKDPFALWAKTDSSIAVLDIYPLPLKIIDLPYNPLNDNNCTMMISYDTSESSKKKLHYRWNYIGAVHGKRELLDVQQI